MTAYMIAILIYIDQAQYFFFFWLRGTKEKGPKHKKQETTKFIKEEARVNQVGCPGVGPRWTDQEWGSAWKRRCL